MTTQFLPQPAKINATNFRPMFVQAVTPVRGGDSQGVDLGETLWMCDLSTTPLTRAQIGAYEAMRMKARGAMFAVYVYDAFAQRPAAYPLTDPDSEEWYASEESWFASEEDFDASGTVRPWGSPIVTAYDQENSLLRITGFNVGAVISVGDNGHWDDGVTRRLVKIVEAPMLEADGSAWVRVEPPPPLSSVNLPSAFVMHQASAEMRIASFDAPVAVGADLWRVTMTAVQILRRST